MHATLIHIISLHVFKQTLLLYEESPFLIFHTECCRDCWYRIMYKPTSALMFVV